jgi:hypothetical protein
LYLDKNTKYSDILEVKIELRKEIQSSFYYVENAQPIIERYSDKEINFKKNVLNNWQPGW